VPVLLIGFVRTAYPEVIAHYLGIEEITTYKWLITGNGQTRA
jgi:hypothetical protein